MNKPILKQEKCQLMINVSDGEGLEYYYFIYRHNFVAIIIIMFTQDI